MNFQNNFKIESDRFNLSIVQESDVEAVFVTMNSPRTANTISFMKWPMTHEQAAFICARSVKGATQKQEFLFLARDKVDSSPVGCVGLNLLTGEVGYWITESWQGRGCATELLKTVCEFAFHSCKLPRLIATAWIENTVSIRILEKQGFTNIGEKNLQTVKETILPCLLFELIK